MVIGTGLVRRKTVEDLVAQRNYALARFSDAHSVLLAASIALDTARQAAHDACNGVTRYNYHQKIEKDTFLSAIKVQTAPDYMAVAQKMIDTDCWAHVIQLTDLETMMDKTAKDQFNSQLLEAPPEFTIDNVLATLDQFMLDAATIFKRGIATCFAKLDRRFRSHDGWKIGSRVILTRVFDEHGWWSFYTNHRDTFQDIERVFSILDGNKPGYCTLTAALESARGHTYGARQTEVETDYFQVRCWKNGNAHIWFKRDDLTEKVNQLLGEYYGAPLFNDEVAEDDGGLSTPKTELAKRFGFYPTPDAAVERIFEYIPLHEEENGVPLTILEPSAGTGQLAYRCLRTEKDACGKSDRRNVIVDCVEVQPALATNLRQSGAFRKVVTADFIQVQPDTGNLYDRVLMNPPFDRERDIDHVMHALKFLKPDGILCAIMSAGTEFRQTRKSIAFRAMVNCRIAEWRDLPAGSFSSVGTNCNTGFLIIKSGKQSRWDRKAFPDDATK